MNKITSTSILLLSSIAAFAQRHSPEQNVRPSRFEAVSELDNNNPEVNAPPPGGVPIDDYQFLLLGLAVLLIAYFIYRRRSQFV